jgi:hypothetical protein
MKVRRRESDMASSYKKTYTTTKNYSLAPGVQGI